MSQGGTVDREGGLKEGVVTGKMRRQERNDGLLESMHIEIKAVLLNIAADLLLIVLRCLKCKKADDKKD